MDPGQYFRANTLLVVLAKHFEGEVLRPESVFYHQLFMTKASNTETE